MQAVQESCRAGHDGGGGTVNIKDSTAGEATAEGPEEAVNCVPYTCVEAGPAEV